MSQSTHNLTDAARTAIIERAIAQGAHSDISQWRTWCDGCGQAVNAVWTITIDKKRLCRKCCEPAGAGRDGATGRHGDAKKNAMPAFNADGLPRAIPPPQ